MKVILTSKIKTLGNIGDVKVVADGYGRNYLIPKKMAIAYSEYNYKFFEEKRKLIEDNNAIGKSRAEEIKAKIDEINLIMIANAGENNKLYGSVSSRNIANFVNDLMGAEYLTKNNIFLQKPIKTLGKFTVGFNLHPDIYFEKEIILTRGETEAVETARIPTAESPREEPRAEE
ncbi:MAG: 50S ribosomal protein L9 [Rickettsiales bacterium]|jgi:large subunit ribosomal protein L9|nr:50S ribosomal protein L9 [Rickettsiales bacterium]